MDDDDKGSKAFNISVKSDDSLCESGGDDRTFEGPEKTMEVLFAADKGHSDGLRALNRKQLDDICLKAKCSILSKTSNNHIDAYVLSESSMFIYKHRFIMKTCGTTTLLRCLGTLIDFTDQLGMVLNWVGYSRKNLNNPDAQLWPHSSFSDEIKYLSTHEKLQNRLKGSGHILGPITGDHWFVYIADPLQDGLLSKSSFDNISSIAESPIVNPPLTNTSNSIERTVNMMMFDIAGDIGELFFQRSGLTAKEMTVKSGINALCPGAIIDENSFEPCGYSMNAILHDSYYTMHVTPEPECSYVSFETNTCLRNYSALIRNSLNIFKPKRFLLTMFSDEAVTKDLVDFPMNSKVINIPNFGNYVRSAISSTKVETEIVCQMGCYFFDGKGCVTSISRERLDSFV